MMRRSASLSSSTKPLQIGALLSLLALCLFNPIRAWADESVFVTDQALSSIYHEGMPCADESDRAFRFIVMPRVAEMGISPEHVRYVLRWAVQETYSWDGRNYCRALANAPGRAEVIYDGQIIAEAVFDTDGSFINNFELNPVGPLPPNDAYGTLIKTVMTQRGALYGAAGWPRDDFDYLAAAQALGAALPTVDTERDADLRYLAAKQMHIEYLKRYRTAKDASGFDKEAFEGAYRDADGEFYHHLAMAEAARLGSPAAILESFKLSLLQHAIHNVLYNKQDSGIRKMPKNRVDSILRNHGYLIAAAEEHNVGRVLGYVAGATEKGYSITEQAIFLDMTLPPGQQAIERALNSDLGAALNGADRILSDMTGLPDGLVYDCDGTWCNITGAYVGRFRMLVSGIPNCTPVTDGRSDCTFRLRPVFSMGKLVEGMPYQSDPVVDYAERFLKETSKLIDDDVVTGTFVVSNTSWALDGTLSSVAR